MRIVGNHFLNITIVGAVKGRTLFYQGIEGKHDVLGGDGFPVMETSFGAQVKAHPSAVLCLLHTPGDKPVLGEGLVKGMEGKSVVNQVKVVG